MSNLKTIKGIGDKTVALLAKEALFACQDLVRYYPKRYEKRILAGADDLESERYHYFEGTVLSKATLTRARKNLTILSFKALFKERELTVRLYNQPFLMKTLVMGSQIVAYGKKTPGTRILSCSRVLLRKNFEEGIYPIYAIDGISDNAFQKYVYGCLDEFEPGHDVIPLEYVKKYCFYPYETFLKAIHQPQSDEDLYQAIKRLKYQELFMYQLKVQLNKAQMSASSGSAKHYEIKRIKSWIQTLPFTLTSSQQEVTNVIYTDLKSTKIMNRMLQGDTGSGKTVVAFLAIYAVMTAGFQTAMMAPTEILANQHYTTLKPYFDRIGYRIELLSGSTPLNQRKSIINDLKEGKIDCLVGTHALFNKDIGYYRLGLVVTDEQHRFGVRQRDALKNKGDNPDILYLSATPIPRTLAMTFFGDMDISTLDEKPSITSKVTTKVVTLKDKDLIRETIKNTLHRNEQIFIIVPVIETQEDSHIQGIDAVSETLHQRYKDARVATLHGQMSANEKIEALHQFKQGKIDILVSTTVVEVGIHVPSATLMVIYHADRFGYAQLHQLRGRLGRGSKEGLCYLYTQGNKETCDRLKVLETVYDGFKLSEEDLKIRGFGDLAGVMQSGILSFAYANITTDLELLKDAREDAITILSEYNNNKKHSALISKIKRQIGA